MLGRQSSQKSDMKSRTPTLWRSHRHLNQTPGGILHEKQVGWAIGIRTKRENISIFILFDSPHARIPTAAKKTAEWWAPRLPIALQRRPYSGVNVHVARRYLSMMRFRDSAQIIGDLWYLRRAEPTSLVWFVKVGGNWGKHCWEKHGNRFSVCRCFFK